MNKGIYQLEQLKQIEQSCDQSIDECIADFETANTIGDEQLQQLVSAEMSAFFVIRSAARARIQYMRYLWN